MFAFSVINGQSNFAEEKQKIKKRKPEKNKENVNYVDLFDRGEWENSDKIINTEIEMKKKETKLKEIADPVVHAMMDVDDNYQESFHRDISSQQEVEETTHSTEVGYK